MIISTAISVKFWEWEPIRKLSAGPKLLWIGLYTTGAGRLSVPGMFFGSITAMAEATHLLVDEVVLYLDKLLEHELVEYDREHRVLRFTKLPDACEAPNNGNCIRGWWRKFHSVPECQVRDAHVPMLRWLMEQAARENGRKISRDHEAAWSDTFATVQIPVNRKRGSRRLIEHDTSTPQQPSLFSEPDLRHSGADPEIRSDSCVSETIDERYPVERDQDQDQVSVSALGSGSVSGDPDPEPPPMPTASQAEAVPTLPQPLRLVPLPVDERSRLQGEIVRAIGYAHAMAFARVKKAVGSTAFGPSVVDDHAELRALVNAMSSLDGVRERLEYVLEIREKQAIHENSTKYFGAGMWRRGNYDKALSLELADVDGTRAAPGAKRSAFAVMDDVFEQIEAEEKLS